MIDQTPPDTPQRWAKRLLCRRASLPPSPTLRRDGCASRETKQRVPSNRVQEPQEERGIRKHRAEQPMTRRVRRLRRPRMTLHDITPQVLGLDSSACVGSFPGVASDAPSDLEVALHPWQPAHPSQKKSPSGSCRTGKTINRTRSRSRGISLEVPLNLGTNLPTLVGVGVGIR